MLQDQKFSKYVDAITNEANAARKQAEQRIEKYKKSRIDNARSQALENSKLEVRRTTARIHQDIGRQFSSDEIEVRKQIFEKREDIKTQVFKEAEKKIISFTQSEAYEPFLAKSMDAIKTKLVGRDKVVTVFLRQEDLKFKEMIQTHTVLPCDFVVDNAIRLGGLRVRFAMVEIDDTLDTRLSSQTQWFEENSGLVVKE